MIASDGGTSTTTTATISAVNGSTTVYSGQDSSLATASRDGLTKTTKISTFAIRTAPSLSQRHAHDQP